jgi:hypothetical protein
VARGQDVGLKTHGPSRGGGSALDVSTQSDLRFEQPRAFAVRTPARLCEAIRVEYESTILASRGDHFHLMAGRDRRTQRMAQILFGVAAPQTHVAGD